MEFSDIILNDDLLELDGIEEARQDWQQYTNMDIPVPRVSHILKQCRNNDGIVQWAANMGRKKYDYYRDRALSIGTLVHELIDDYLIAKYINHTEFEIDYSIIEDSYRESVFNCIENFKLWESTLESNGFHIEEVYALELPVTCPWYGGTIDAIFKINGLYYIIDFKTSKKISPEYLLQTAAYMWTVNKGYDPSLPHISGIGIIRVDKQKYGIVNDLFMNEFIMNQKEMLYSYQSCFMSYVDAYYKTIHTDYITDNYNYNMNTVFSR